MDNIVEGNHHLCTHIPTCIWGGCRENNTVEICIRDHAGYLPLFHQQK